MFKTILQNNWMDIKLTNCSMKHTKINGEMIQYMNKDAYPTHHSGHKQAGLTLNAF